MRDLNEEVYNLILKIETLFSEFERRNQYNIDKLLVDNYFINKTNKEYFSVSAGLDRFYICSKRDEYIFESSQYDDYEQLYDELVIFKELILPKYL